MSDAPKIQTRDQMLAGLARSNLSVAEVSALTDATWQAGWAAGREAAAGVCENAAISLISNGRARVNQVDTHTAQVLRGREAAIRALPVPPRATDGEAG